MAGTVEGVSLIPLDDALDRAIEIVPNLVDPEPHHVPPTLPQPLTSNLISTTRLAVPGTVVPRTIDLDRKPSRPGQERQIHGVRPHEILWHRAKTGSMERVVEDAI